MARAHANHCARHTAQARSNTLVLAGGGGFPMFTIIGWREGFAHEHVAHARLGLAQLMSNVHLQVHPARRPGHVEPYVLPDRPSAWWCSRQASLWTFGKSGACGCRCAGACGCRAEVWRSLRFCWHSPSVTCVLGIIAEHLVLALFAPPSCRNPRQLNRRQCPRTERRCWTRSDKYFERPHCRWS